MSLHFVRLGLLRFVVPSTTYQNTQIRLARKRLADWEARQRKAGKKRT